jgi:hypothetical protein
MMANPLKVEQFYSTRSTNTMKITGFTYKELSELNSMDYREMKETVLDMLDDRNGGLGSCWHNGYYVFSMWVR